MLRLLVLDSVEPSVQQPPVWRTFAGMNHELLGCMTNRLRVVRGHRD